MYVPRDNTCNARFYLMRVVVILTLGDIND